jgi:hypothetical protein
VVPVSGLDDVEKRKLLILPGLELRSLGRPSLIKRWDHQFLFSPFCLLRKSTSTLLLRNPFLSPWIIFAAVTDVSPTDVTVFFLVATVPPLMMSVILTSAHGRPYP